MEDNTVIYLANAITQFADSVDKKLDAQATTIDEILSKQYTVNHEPKIELPFEAEYEYVRDSLDSMFADDGGLNNLTHIFLSGYLPNGKTIRFTEGVYINGVALTEDYTCRAEEGSLEKLNLFIVGASSIDYSDFPLENFKMIIYDDVPNPSLIDVASFIRSNQIDTLKCFGDLKWTCSEMSRLRALHATGDIVCESTIALPCLQEFICPNIIDMVNTNIKGSLKESIVKIDISNCSGAIRYLQGASIYGVMEVHCRELLGMAQIKCSEVICGESLVCIGEYGLSNCPYLTKVTFNNARAITMAAHCMRDNHKLDTIKFSLLSSMSPSSLLTVTALRNLSFIDNSIRCPLYFASTSVLTEESCLNIINAIVPDAKVNVALSRYVCDRMAVEWYCKLVDGRYVSCDSTDKDARTQEQALISKGGVLI